MNNNKQKILLWHDLNYNKFFLINEGNTLQVNSNGDFIKKFYSDLSGKATYESRVERAKEVLKKIQQQKDPSIMPFSPDSLNYSPIYYIPKPKKFNGYTQVPRQRCGSEQQTIRPLLHITGGSTMDLTRSQMTNRKLNQNTASKHPQSLNTSLKIAQTLQEQNNPPDLSNEKKVKQYNFTTFEGKNFLYPMNKNTLFQMKVAKDIQKELELEKNQLKSFQLPMKKEHCTIQTKGRFLVNMLKPKKQIKQPVQETDEKKIQRRIHGKIKEKEMLERNLKNKI